MSFWSNQISPNFIVRINPSDWEKLGKNILVCVYFSVILVSGTFEAWFISDFKYMSV
jgi:hypothetical protein